MRNIIIVFFCEEHFGPTWQRRCRSDWYKFMPRCDGFLVKGKYSFFLNLGP